MGLFLFFDQETTYISKHFAHTLINLSHRSNEIMWIFKERMSRTRSSYQFYRMMQMKTLTTWVIQPFQVGLNFYLDHI